MSLEVVTVTRSKPALDEPVEEQGELVRRVAASVTFEKSPRLRAFFQHVCRCAIESRAEEATEQQIGIAVYGRSPSYNANDDNIVRSQARVLRMKLEHHFACEGKDEPVIITIPKGQYLPVFERRETEPAKAIALVEPEEPGPARGRKLDSMHLLLIWLAVAQAIAIACLTYMLFAAKRTQSLDRRADPAVVAGVSWGAQGAGAYSPYIRVIHRGETHNSP